MVLSPEGYQKVAGSQGNACAQETTWLGFAQKVVRPFKSHLARGSGRLRKAWGGAERNPRNRGPRDRSPR